MLDEVHRLARQRSWGAMLWYESNVDHCSLLDLHADRIEIDRDQIGRFIDFEWNGD